MTLFQRLSGICSKLNLSQHDVIVLYATNRIGLGRYGLIRAMALLSKLVEVHKLSDSEYEPSYGIQLAQKGILTEEEGEFFASSEILSEAPQAGKGNGAIGAGDAPQGRSEATALLSSPSVPHQKRTRTKTKGTHPEGSPKERNVLKRPLEKSAKPRRSNVRAGVLRVPGTDVDSTQAG